MTPETAATINKFLYHLSTEEFAAADKTLNSLIEQKVQTLCNNATTKVKAKHSRENK
jgi:hypothetical protein